MVTTLAVPYQRAMRNLFLPTVLLVTTVSAQFQFNP